MQNPFSWIGHVIKQGAIYVKDEFAKFFGSDQAKAFASAAIGLLKSDAGKIALDAVQFASTLTTDGAGKRKAAFDKILADFKVAGIEGKDSIINLLIEAAVQFAKGAFGEGESPAS